MREGRGKRGRGEKRKVRARAAAAAAAAVAAAASAATGGDGGVGGAPMYSGDDVPPQPPAPVQQPSPYGHAMGAAGDAAAVWLPAPNVAPPTAASAAGYPPGAAC
ncbi:unnamed protein product [Taenia asiatica]|uniref:Uncharacterized protein n=1 Tax=Taenia asiatica TaxID=60517 RepID=A0A0R3WH09_TAEAS|nr:unnamed protein product [Taenia asiatica]